MKKLVKGWTILLIVHPFFNSYLIDIVCVNIVKYKSISKLISIINLFNKNTIY